jgi:uncharacterized membrane protein YfcA
MQVCEGAIELVGVVLGGAASGATGLAFPLVAGPFLLAVNAPPKAVALMALCSMTCQFSSMALLRQTVPFRLSPWLIGGGLAGVPVGSALLAQSDPAIVRICLGALIAGSGFWACCQPTVALPRPASWRQEAIVGLCGGVTGGLAGASALLPAIWCARRGWTKEYQRAITQPYVLVMQALSLALLWRLGAVDPSVLVSYLELLGPLILGIAVGVTVFKALPTRLLARAVVALAAMSGLALLLGA